MLTGGVVHGTQLWVNLPRARKMTPPRYQDIRGTQAALLTAPDGGALIRVIARDIAGHAGPGSTRTPIILAHITVEPGAQVDLPWHPGYNALIYALAGAGTVGAENRPIRLGLLGVFGEGDALRVAADPRRDSHAPKLELYVMGGQPIREPVAHHGPFVMNTRDELIQAFEDYQAGRLGVIPAIRHPPSAIRTPDSRTSAWARQRHSRTWSNAPGTMSRNPWLARADRRLPPRARVIVSCRVSNPALMTWPVVECVTRLRGRWSR